MIAEGAIVPGHITIGAQWTVPLSLPNHGTPSQLLLAVAGLLEAAVKNSSNNKFLIDGFPRELPQLISFETEVITADQSSSSSRTSGVAAAAADPQLYHTTATNSLVLLGS